MVLEQIHCHSSWISQLHLMAWYGPFAIWWSWRRNVWGTRHWAVLSIVVLDDEIEYAGNKGANHVAAYCIYWTYVLNICNRMVVFSGKSFFEHIFQTQYFRWQSNIVWNVAILPRTPVYNELITWMEGVGRKVIQIILLTSFAP